MSDFVKGLTSPRYALVIVTLALGLCAWLIAGSVIFIDSMIVTPTVAVVLHPTTPPTSRPIVTLAATASSTATPSTPIPSPGLILATVTQIPQTNTPVPPTATTANSQTCTTPAGWIAYTIESGDTLFGFVLGSKNTLSVEAIMVGNCLKSRTLIIGQAIFLPPGVADLSPKIDDSSADPTSAANGNLPAGSSRVAHCPCTIEVRPGWRIEQIAVAVDKTAVGFTGADFWASVVPGAATPALGILSSRPSGKSLEGYMLPGSYSLANDTSAVQFRDMMLNAFAASVSAQVQADAAAHGLTFWQALVLASIIQRESAAPKEQKLIASVFHNRLAANNGLAATVTLQYALGSPSNWWPRVSSTKLDSPYNTHLYPGLPPSPIASPGLDAILAAVYPAQTDYRYFAGKCGGGGNFYATTFAEFQQGLKCGGGS
ncbi:MAG: endolytic transglycosylase MltG [Chloroflexota bacterium]